MLINLRILSIKLAYTQLVKENSDIGALQIWQSIWSAKLHKRYKSLLWRIASNSLSTRNNLKRFIVNIDAFCPFCSTEKEIREHLFILCPYMQNLWLKWKWGVRIQHFVQFDIISFFELYLSLPHSLIRGKKDNNIFTLTILLIMDVIQRMLNELIFRCYFPFESTYFVSQNLSG